MKRKKLLIDWLFSLDVKYIFFVLIISSLTGCGMEGLVNNAPSTGINQVSDNIYEIMDVDYRGAFGSDSSLIERNVSQADAFAATQGKVAVPILARKHKYAYGSEWSWFYYKFSLAEAGTPESKIKFSDIVVERDPNSSLDFYNNRYKVGQIGVSDEIVQLDELRKKGILTDVEFEKKKTSILNR